MLAWPTKRPSPKSQFRRWRMRCPARREHSTWRTTVATACSQGQESCGPVTVTLFLPLLRFLPHPTVDACATCCGRASIRRRANSCRSSSSRGRASQEIRRKSWSPSPFWRALRWSPLGMCCGLLEGEKAPHELIIKCIIILTSVVPRGLPMQMSLAVKTALMSLHSAGVFSTEPFRELMAGKVTHCLFHPHHWGTGPSRRRESRRFLVEGQGSGRVGGKFLNDVRLPSARPWWPHVGRRSHRGCGAQGHRMAVWSQWEHSASWSVGWTSRESQHLRRGGWEARCRRMRHPLLPRRSGWRHASKRSKKSQLLQRPPRERNAPEQKWSPSVPSTYCTGSTSLRGFNGWA